MQKIDVLRLPPRGREVKEFSASEGGVEIALKLQRLSAIEEIAAAEMAEEMEQLETGILKGRGISNPYE